MVKIIIGLMCAFFVAVSLVSAIDCGSNSQYIPQDPDFVHQWYLHNTNNNGVDINATQAWCLETGSEEVVVAVISSGVQLGHLDLYSNIWVNQDEIVGNNVDDDGNGYIDDIYGYNFVAGNNNVVDELGIGTSVAGIIAAKTNNLVNHPVHSSVYRGNSKVYSDLQGLSRTSVEHLYVGTSAHDNIVRTFLYGNPNEQLQWFVAPTQNPLGITLVGSDVWISDPEEQLLYSTSLSFDGVHMSKIRMTITGSYVYGGSEVFRIHEIQAMEGDHNWAAGTSATSNSVGWSSYTVDKVVDQIDNNDLNGAFMVYNSDYTWVEIDFGASRYVEVINLIYELYNPKDFTLEYYDGQWHEIVVVQDNMEMLNSFFAGIAEMTIIDSFPSPGSSPRGLHYDGYHLWNVDQEDNMVHKLTLDGVLVDSFAVPDMDLWGVTVQNNHVYVQGRHISVLNKHSGELLNQFRAGIRLFHPSFADSQPRALATTPDGAWLMSVDDGVVNGPNIDNSTVVLINPHPESYQQRGVAGMCWNCKIMPLQVYTGWEVNLDAAAQAIRYAYDNGADIIVMPWSTTVNSPVLREAVEYASESLLIASSGDSSDRLVYPAAYDAVLSVSATNSIGYSSYSSSHNWPNYHWIDIAAPGDSIYTTRTNHQYGYQYDPLYASAVVAGAAALIKSHHDSSPDEIKGRLMATTNPYGVSIQYYPANPLVVPDTSIGQGIIDVYSSLISPPVNLITFKKYELLHQDFIRPGAVSHIEITLKNQWLPSSDVQVSFVSDDVSVISGAQSFGFMGLQEEKTRTFIVHISDDASIINAQLVVSAQGYQTTIPVVFEVRSVLEPWNPPSLSVSTHTVGDVNGDGTLNVVFRVRDSSSQSDKVYVLGSDGRPLEGWPVSLSSVFSVNNVPITLADTDGDNKLELAVIVREANGRRIYLVDDDGSIINSHLLASSSSSNVVAGDINNDGSTELFVAHRSGYLGVNYLHILVFDNHLNPLPTWNYDPVEMNPYENVREYISVADITNDGYLELIIPTNQVYAYRYDGTPLDGFPASSSYYSDTITGLATGDVTGTGGSEIVLTTYYGLIMFDEQGQEVWGQPCDWDWCYSQQAILGDLDNDGQLEIVRSYATEQNYNQYDIIIHILSSQGNLLHQWSVSNTQGSSHQILLVDVDDDGFSDVVVSMPDWLYAYKMDGSLISSFPKGRFSGWRASLFDFTNNGLLEIISSQTKLDGWSTNIPAGMSDWPSQYHDYQLTNNYEFIPTIQRCEDRVAYNACSHQKPNYCDEGVIVEQCQLCGCPNNLVCGTDNRCRTKGSKVDIERPQGGMLR